MEIREANNFGYLGPVHTTLVSSTAVTRVVGEKRCVTTLLTPAYAEETNTTPEKFETQQSPDRFGLRNTRKGKSHDYLDVICF